jgi:pSer/pThr/pTyr-binding forkhead associated (FHA) protein/tetratricopeptide (TPR) repeat protein
MPTLVIKSPDGTEQERDFGAELTVGRAAGNDLILAEGGVSRKHARFFIEGDALMVEDLGSANGTILNGERIDGPSPVDPSAVVVLGDYEVSLKAESRANRASARARSTQGEKSQGERPQGDKRAALAPKGERSTKVLPVMKQSPVSSAKRSARSDVAGPTLRGLSGTITGKSFPVSGVAVIGRVAGVDIRIDDDSVSRRHAEVEILGTEAVIRDLGSANGTTVNGEPVLEDTALAPGDIIQFGVVELMFENGPASAIKPMGRPSRVPASRSARRSRPDASLDGDALSDVEKGANPKRRMLLIAGGISLTVLFVAVVAKALMPSPEVVEPKANTPGDVPTPLAPKATVSPENEIEDLLRVCRTYASCEGRQPDWAKAEAACERIIDLEPIHGPANDLMKRIKHERAAEEAFLKGKELSASGRLEDALEAFSKVRPFSKELMGCYFLDTLATAKPVIDETKKLLANECKTYANNGKWENALKRCEAYMRLACQSMRADDLDPPYPQKLKLEGSLGKHDWRPNDSNYLNFLKARNKLRPGEAPWKCPEVPVFRPPPPPPNPESLALSEFKARYTEEAMGRSLQLYFKGAFAEAPVPVQKILESVSKAKLHDEARVLLLDINNAISLFKTGQTELSNDRPEKAEEPFRKALALDEKLVLGEKASKLKDDEKRRELEKRSSFVRRGVVEGMSNTCYQKGKAQADKNDFRAACRIWKLGLSFSRANADLLRACYVCTQKATDALKKANSCQALNVVLDLAVEGDGLKERVEESKLENKCP